MNTKKKRFRRLTITQVLAALARLHQKGWVSFLKNNADELRLRPPHGNRCFCPLTAAYWERYGRFIAVEKVFEPIFKDKATGPTRDTVAFAADYGLASNELDTARRQLRRRMFKILDLADYLAKEEREFRRENVA